MSLYYPETKPVRFEANEELLCPVCIGNYLHQKNTEVVNRLVGEDGDCMVHNVKSQKEIETTVLDKSKCHGRRDYVLISFECEFCDRPDEYSPHYVTIPWKLRIMQHKGCTFIDWIKEDE